MILAVFLSFAINPILGDPVAQDTTPRTVIVAIDLSSSAPAASHEGYAASAGQWVATRLRQLEYRDRIQVRTLGAYDAERNLFQRDFELNRSNRPNRIAAAVGQLIAGLPTHISDGRLQIQEQTNLLAFIDDMSRAYPCRQNRVEFILVSDGIESSALANAYELSRSTSGGFPAPRPGSLEGCSLTIIGLGQGIQDPNRVNRLRQLWSEWAAAAGADSAHLLTTW